MTKLKKKVVSYETIAVKLLSTKISWNFNYETYIRRDRYVSHPVY